ncbi:MAG: hypothetical protein ACLPI9_03215, partial [Halobacteriota archaeon]
GAYRSSDGNCRYRKRTAECVRGVHLPFVREYAFTVSLVKGYLRQHGIITRRELISLKRSLSTGMPSQELAL